MSCQSFFYRICGFLIACFSGFSPVLAIPQGPFTDSVSNPNIKTVLFHKQGWEFSYPVLNMNDNNPLVFSFDELVSKSKNYNYSIVFCDADWMPSRVSFNEYMDGFFQNPLVNYQSSFSTHIPYVHYSLQIPNENISLKLPGNYVLLVYENGNEDEPVLTKRFCMVDEKLAITGEVRRPVLPAYQEAFQQLEFSIQHNDYVIENPYQTVKVVIVKNGIWKLSLSDIKPLYIREHELLYNYQDKNLFAGGNEFRSFDLKSLKYQSANVESLGFVGNSYQMVLKSDLPRNRTGYFYTEDLNGKYLIQNQQGQTPETDAEYVRVAFSLARNTPVENGNVYLFGAITNFALSEGNQMKYSPQKPGYELELLVKQGYYNYQYTYSASGTSNIDETILEGSFYETENDYLIFVYHRPYGSRYDRLIGMKVMNSLRRNK